MSIPLRENLNVNPEYDPAQVESGLSKEMQSLMSGTSPWPLFLYGKAGTGKTCAAGSLLHFCACKTWYKTISDFCAEMQEAKMGRLETGSGYQKFTQDLWRDIDGARLVVVDELGSHSKVSDFRYEVTKELIDRASKKPAIYISNLDPQDLEKVYDDRIVSRICRGTVVELKGKDRRIS